MRYLFEILAALHESVDLREYAAPIQEPFDLAKAVVSRCSVIVRLLPRFTALYALIQSFYTLLHFA
jgi:hypothetical protein